MNDSPVPGKLLSDGSARGGRGLTLRQLRREGARDLRPPDGESGFLPVSTDVLLLEADLLLGHALGLERAQIAARLDETADQASIERFGALLRRRRNGEPIAYILGFKEFFGRDFAVSTEVLIPRPETELLVERALLCLEEREKTCFLCDVGTGSGAVILSVLAELKKAGKRRVSADGPNLALDVSPAALEIARRNARNLGLSGDVEFVCSDLLCALELPRLGAGIIMANLPYVPEGVGLPRDVARFEPALALRGGEKGSEIIEQLIEQAVPGIKAGDWLLFEIGQGQDLEVESSLRLHRLNEVRYYRDLSETVRVVEVRG